MLLELRYVTINVVQINNYAKIQNGNKLSIYEFRFRSSVITPLSPLSPRRRQIHLYQQSIGV
jgi:hypothetical protein